MFLESNDFSYRFGFLQLQPAGKVSEFCLWLAHA